LGRLLREHQTGLKHANGKHSSLFCHSVSSKEKSF
jgi:hypothetical protein